MTTEELQKQNNALREIIVAVRASLCDVHNQTQDAATHVFASGLIENIDQALASE